MIEVTPLAMPEVKFLTFRRHADARGHFVETYAAQAFAAAGLPTLWVQDNEAFSAAAGTVRGLHFQTPPHGQAKLVRVVSGRILDVVVDVRRGSPTFGQHTAVALSADRSEALFIPEGFAHGYCTLSLETMVQYKVSRPYAPVAERTVLWCDPALGIAWPVGPEQAIVSARDAAAAPFAALDGGA
jgi:dTDP-4-dehydrorhamnose 3,5-epimerase